MSPELPTKEDLILAGDLQHPDMWIVNRNVIVPEFKEAQISEIYRRYSDDTYWLLCYEKNPESIQENNYTVKRVKDENDFGPRLSVI